MGITLHTKLGQKKNAVKGMLDRTQKLAEAFQKQAEAIDIEFKIRRMSDTYLLVDIGHCETLVFNFKTMNEWRELMKEEARGKGQDTVWHYQIAVLTDDGKQRVDEGYRVIEFPDNAIYYSAEFCKTQFSKSLAEHRWVAELIRSVASYCFIAEVSDEGDYYHTGKIQDAEEAIAENGALISSIGKQLEGLGYENIDSDKTHIKGRGKKNDKGV